MPDALDMIVNSIFGIESIVSGDVSINGLARIDGSVSGDITTTGKIVIGSSARLESNVRAKSAVVGGVIKGDVYVTDRLTILSGGMIVGNVFAPKIDAEDGVVIHGDVSIAGDVNKSEERRESFAQAKAKHYPTPKTSVNDIVKSKSAQRSGPAFESIWKE